MNRKKIEDSVKIQSKKAEQKSIFSISAKIYRLFSSLEKSFGGKEEKKTYQVSFLKKELKTFVDTLDIEDEELREKIYYFVSKIFQSEDISEDILYIITIMKEVFGKEFVNENMDSFAHVLESVFTCSRMPEIYDVKEYLDNTFPGVSQTEFMILITLFHDLKKTYKPSQYLEPIDAIKGGHLSSHQRDGAKFLLEGIENKKSDIYSYIGVFLSKKNIDISKISEFGNIMAKIIEGHAGNTEFIQIDTARTLLNIINYIDDKFSNIENFTKLKNRTVLFMEDLAKEKLVSFSEVDFLKNLKQKDNIIVYLKRLLIQKYIHRNIGRRIGLMDINLDRVDKLCGHLDKHMNKEESLSKLLEDSSNTYMLEDIIEEKKELWRELDDDINKYLHPTFFEDSIDNKMRLLFNINDIQSYVVPSSVSFRKLLYHNTIDRLLSSPINGAVDVLAQLQLGIERSDSTMEKGFYQAMYYNGITNLKELINTYHIQMKKILDEEAPKEIKAMGITCKDAYIKACNMNYQTPEELKLIKDFFVFKIDELCDGLDTNIVYPSIKLEGHTLLCDGLGDLAYTETLDVFSKILVDESIDTIKITSNMTTNQKRILYNMLTNNYPLLEILRLTENSQIVNIKFTGYENVIYEVSIDFLYNILDTIKNILVGRFDEFYKTEKIKGRVVRNHYNNITFSIPGGKLLDILFADEKDKKQIIEKAIEEKMTYIEENALKLGKTKEFIINTVISNLNFGIGNFYLGNSLEDSEKIDAFYKADIMSRQEINRDNIGISVFSEGFIKNLVVKSKSLEKELIEKYKDTKCEINGIEHSVVVTHNGTEIINPVLFRYVRKYSSKNKYSNIEIMNSIGVYIDLIDSCFEFISFFVREENPFQEVADINDNFAKGLIKTKNITQNHKGTYARQSLLELTSNKGGLRMIINIDGMTIDNIDLFKIFSDKILDDNLKKSEFFIIGHDITVKFVEAVDLIKNKYPEAIISIGGYEKYIYIPYIDNMDSFIDFVSQALDSKKLKARLSYNYCDTVLDSKESYDRLLNSNKIVLYIEQFMEETIYELGLQDKVQTPNNISLYIGDKELYFIEENIIRKGLKSIIKKAITHLSLGEDILDLKDVIEIGDSKLDVTLSYKNHNMSLKIETGLVSI